MPDHFSYGIKWGKSISNAQLAKPNNLTITYWPLPNVNYANNRQLLQPVPVMPAGYIEIVGVNVLVYQKNGGPGPAQQMMICYLLPIAYCL